MKVEVDINRNDYWNYNRYATFKIPKLRNIFLFNFISIPVAVFAILMIIRLPLYYCIAAALIGGALCDMLIFYSFKRRVMKLPDSKDGLLGKHIIEVNEAGVKESTEFNNGFYNWKGIRSVEKDKNNIYIFVDSLTSHIIPIRAFSKESEAEEFFNKIFEYWRIKHHSK